MIFYTDTRSSNIGILPKNYHNTLEIGRSVSGSDTVSILDSDSETGWNLAMGSDSDLEIESLTQTLTQTQTKTQTQNQINTRTQTQTWTQNWTLTPGLGLLCIDFKK